MHRPIWSAYCAWAAFLVATPNRQVVATPYLFNELLEEGLQIRNKRPKRKVSAKLREDRRPPAAPNEVWAMDFLSDQLFDGRKIRVLTIVDAYSKMSPAIDVRARYTSADVVATLDRVCAEHGMPSTIRVDNGPAFISRNLDL